MQSRKVTAARIEQYEGIARYAAQIAETREYVRNKRRAQADELLQQLVSISPVFRDCRPLVTAIEKEIRAALNPSPSLRTVRAALRLHTRSEEYLKALAAAGSVRYHLDGSPAGGVRYEHREKAVVMLAR